MSFGDINNYYLRKEPATDPIQKIVNQYTFEDDDHWRWFLEDIEVLGYNHPKKFADTLHFLWGEETRAARNLSYQLISYAINATPIQGVVLGEAMEATSHAFFDVSNAVSAEIREITPIVDLRFLGQTHQDAESSHTTIGSVCPVEIEKIELSCSEREDAFELVNNVFSLFDEYSEEMLSYAMSNFHQLSASRLSIA